MLVNCEDIITKDITKLRVNIQEKRECAYSPVEIAAEDSEENAQGCEKIIFSRA